MPLQLATANPQIPAGTRWLRWMILVIAALWLATLGGRKLLNPDEGRYAEIPREMVASGDWLTPRLNDLKYFEKPPLQYWATAVAYKALGQSDFAARLWCGLTGLAGILFIGWTGGRLFGREAGMIAATLLAGSLMYFALGHWNTLDMGLTFFLTMAVGSFLVAQQEPIGSRTERNFMLVAWGAVALALLSKGVVALVLPTLTLIVYTAIEREYSAWRRLHVVPGLLLFLIVGAPWLIAVSLTNPEFPKFFFLHEHFARFLTDVHQRVQPWWYFLPFLIAGALPWASLAVAAIVKAWGSDSGTEEARLHPRRFLVIWIAVTVVFFSASQSKLAPYILPAFPALALLTGDYVVAAANRTIRNHLIGISVLWVVVLGYLAFALIWGPLPQKSGIPPHTLAAALRWVAAGVTIALAATVLARALAGRGRIHAALASMSVGAIAFLSILIMQFDAARMIRSGYDLAQIIKPQLNPKLPLYSILTYDHSLAFYLNLNSTIVNYQGELAFGQKQEPGESLATWEDFSQAWQRDPVGSAAVMKREAFEALTHDGVPMEVIGSNLQLVAVKKP
jgi:4-amino-4-deoxy-L-arabinose transferase-like glycosyltransferase